MDDSTYDKDVAEYFMYQLVIEKARQSDRKRYACQRDGNKGNQQYKENNLSHNKLLAICINL